ncbi:MAG: hypothetical protein GF383_06905 [Candidatus Lokiarchaeota archaeon]|nr:hypothetical protein [Candidatus Lokiarchaeota archaeon]MBD3339878.1 hypothetical protein [Candidatus Lokiarchaeota archaeon]
MVKREWNIEFTIKAENNIKQILLYKTQNISLLNAQSFLKGFYETLEDLKLFPRMYAKLPDLDDPNIRHFVYNKYRIIYELIEDLKIIRILTLFHSKQKLKL